MTTIDDARKALQRSLDCEVYPIFEVRHVEATDLRTLLAHTADYDALKGRLEGLTRLRPDREWREDHGFVLWWRLPIEEPPYVGSPICDDWIEDYYTHWSPLPRVAAFLDREKEAGRG